MGHQTEHEVYFLVFSVEDQKMKMFPQRKSVKTHQGIEVTEPVTK